MGFLSYVASAVFLGAMANSVRKTRRARREENEEAERTRRRIEEELRRDREEHEAWLRELEERRKRNALRKRTAFRFYDDLSREEFSRIVAESRKGIKRLISISCTGSTVTGVVRSQSKLTEWTFRLDFNDWGRLTGSYWITSENDDTVIPKVVGDRISSAIISKVGRVARQEPAPEEPPIEFVPCPSCGVLVQADLPVCPECGRPLKDGERDNAKRSRRDNSGQSVMSDEKARNAFLLLLMGFVIAVLALVGMLV